MDIEVKEDGIVGAWHRWVIISVASTVMFSYIIFASFNMLIRFSGIEERFGFVTAHDPFDWRLLLIAIPWGILRGEFGYQKDLKVNGSKAVAGADNKDKLI